MPAKTQNSEVRIVAIEMEDQSFTVYSIPSLPSLEFGLGESDSENGDDRLEHLDEIERKNCPPPAVEQIKTKKESLLRNPEEITKDCVESEKWTHEAPSCNFAGGIL